MTRHDEGKPMKARMKASHALFAALLLLAGTAHGTDLLETYHAAQAQDAQFAAARAAKAAGEEKAPQGRAQLLPSVNFNANASLNDMQTRYTSNLFPSGHQRYNSHGYGVTLTQPLFREQNWALYSESELQVVQSDAQFRQAEQDLALRTARAYFDVLLARDNVELAGAQKTAITEQLAQARRNFEVGSATVTDIQEAQARYDLVGSQELAAQSDLEVKRRTLQQLTNAPPGELAGPGPAFRLDPPQPASVDKWVEQAATQNQQVVIAQAGAELADKEVDRSRGGHLPTVDLVASHTRTIANGGAFGIGSDQTVTSVGVQANLALFQGGATQSKWREAEANRDRARYDLESARRGVELQTRQAYIGVTNGIAQVQALQQALKSSASLLEATKLGYETGSRTNLDVLNAQQQLYATRRDLYQAQYNYLLSELALQAAAGALGEDGVARVNQALK